MQNLVEMHPWNLALVSDRSLTWLELGQRTTGETGCGWSVLAKPQSLSYAFWDCQGLAPGRFLFSLLPQPNEELKRRSLGWGWGVSGIASFEGTHQLNMS